MTRINCDECGGADAGIAHANRLQRRGRVAAAHYRAIDRLLLVDRREHEGDGGAVNVVASRDAHRRCEALFGFSQLQTRMVPTRPVARVNPRLPAEFASRGSPNLHIRVRANPKY